MELDQQYWNNLYSEKMTVWDVGTITPPLKEYVDQLHDLDISILIPGCGNGYEAAYLLEKGFTNITLIDISSLVCKLLEEKFAADLGSRVNIVCGSFFDLQGTFDLVIEQTFFCALDPSLRQQYATKMQQLLNINGKLTGLLFDRTFEEGPPFGGSEAEYRELFSQYFTIAIMEPCYNSIAPRQGVELFIKLLK